MLPIKTSGAKVSLRHRAKKTGALNNLRGTKTLSKVCLWWNLWHYEKHLCCPDSWRGPIDLMQNYHKRKSGAYVAFLSPFVIAIFIKMFFLKVNDLIWLCSLSIDILIILLDRTYTYIYEPFAAPLFRRLPYLYNVLPKSICDLIQLCSLSQPLC